MDDSKDITAKYTPKLLPGVFTVNDSGKKVKFTKGSLYWNGKAFRCESNQYDFPTTWDENHVGHFYWSKDASIAIAESYSDDERTTTDKFFAADGGVFEGFTVLSDEEWQYLIDNSLHTEECGEVFWYSDYENGHSLWCFTGTKAQARAAFDANTVVREGYEGKSFDELYGNLTITSLETMGRNIAGVGCVILKPDGFSGEIKETYTASEWAAAEAAGLVALPITGSRSGSGIYGINGDGRCWLSTPHENYASYAWSADFNSGEDYTYNYNRYNGYSVRLVSVQ